MLTTKSEAMAHNRTESSLCRFHLSYPDQAASMGYCKRCKIIEDGCGCQEDDACAECDPQNKWFDFRNNFYQRFSKKAIRESHPIKYFEKKAETERQSKLLCFLSVV